MKIDVLTTVNDLLSALSLAMDLEQSGKQYHGWRSSVIAAFLGKELEPDRRQSLFYATMLHDIGGIGLNHNDLHAFIQPAEGDTGVYAHPARSAEIIAMIPGLSSAREAVAEHHERWNGSGYPLGLSENEIGFEGQLMQAADYIDVMMRTRRITGKESLHRCFQASKGKLFSERLAGLVQDCCASISPSQLEGICDLKFLPEFHSLTRDMMGPILVPDEIDVIEAVLNIFALVIDTKHPYTKGHSHRVADYARDIAGAMGWKDDALTELRWAGLLHDVGKLCVPLEILDKASSLTDNEYRKVKHHAHHSYEIISMISTLKHIALPAAGHHERIDGRGYPFGLSGEEIPASARILCVADAFDAMTSGRAYLREMPIDKIISIFEKNKGAQFDPDVVDKGLEVLLEKRFGKVEAGNYQAVKNEGRR